MYAVNYYLMENLCSQLLYAVITFLRFPKQQIIQIGKTEWNRALFVVVFSLISYSLILYVLMTEKVSYVTAIRQCSAHFCGYTGWVCIERNVYKTKIICSSFDGNWYILDYNAIVSDIVSYKKKVRYDTEPIR